MAKARIIPPTPAEPDVQLTLSAREARVLAALTNHVAGSPYNTYRRDVDQIRLALAAAGIPAVSGEYFRRGTSVEAKEVTP